MKLLTFWLIIITFFLYKIAVTQDFRENLNVPSDGRIISITANNNRIIYYGIEGGIHFLKITGNFINKSQKLTILK